VPAPERAPDHRGTFSVSVSDVRRRAHGRAETERQSEKNVSFAFALRVVRDDASSAAVRRVRLTDAPRVRRVRRAVRGGSVRHGKDASGGREHNAGGVRGVRRRAAKRRGAFAKAPRARRGRREKRGLWRWAIWRWWATVMIVGGTAFVNGSTSISSSQQTRDSVGDHPSCFSSFFVKA